MNANNNKNLNLENIQKILALQQDDISLKHTKCIYTFNFNIKIEKINKLWSK